MIKTIHILLLIVSLFSASTLIGRFWLIKIAHGKNSLYLLLWGLALLLSLPYFILLLVADFAPQSGLTQLFPGIAPWIIFATLMLFLASTFNAISHYRLFWSLWVVPLLSLSLLIFMLFIFPSIAKLDYFHLEGESDIIVADVLAPLQILLAFLFLFLGLNSLGRYFWRWRFAGFLLVAFSFLFLGALNLSHPYLKEIALPWTVNTAAFPRITVPLWQELSGFLYLCLNIGFYLATLPRRVKRDHGSEVSIDHQKIKLAGTGN